MNLLKDPNKRKWVIVATMFIAIICNYLDRQLLSILKPEILEHFDIGDMEYAWIVNVFLICYALMYPVSGILVDRFGPKRVMLAGIVVWSLACLGGGLSQTVWQFSICRGILGLAEPTIFAGQLVAVTLWFEKRQRATANSLCTIGGSLGAVVAPLVIAWLMRWFSNWQEVFMVAGVIGLLIALLWIIVYRTPSPEILDKTVNADRTPSGNIQKPFTFKGLLRTRTLWGALLIRLISDPVWYFCCFWLPGYLRGMGEAQNLSHEQTLNMIQWIGGIPFLVGAAGGMLMSIWSDTMIKRGRNALSARKIVLVMTIVFAPLCAIVPYVSECALPFAWRVGLVVAIFSLVAVLCLTWLYTVPVVMPETFPIKNVATVMGICCGSGALGSMVFNHFIGTLSAGAMPVMFGIMSTLHIITTVVLWKMVRVEMPDED